MDYRRGDGAAISAPLLLAGGNGHLTEMHHSSHPPTPAPRGFFCMANSAYARAGAGWERAMG
jgi:hypothetical protein